MTLNDVSDYITLKVMDAGVGMNLLKLQKLVYYSQAWHLAIKGRPLFDGKFQAWVHGPVSRQLYDRFSATKSLYSPMLTTDIRSDFDPNDLSSEDRAHLDAVLEVYAQFTGSQLEEMTHQEDPWNEARKGFAPSQRCEVDIDEEVMKRYYGARLEKAKN